MSKPRSVGLAIAGYGFVLEDAGERYRTLRQGEAIWYHEYTRQDDIELRYALGKDKAVQEAALAGVPEPEERTDPAHMERVQKTADCLYVPRDYIPDPVFHAFLTNVVDANDLAARAEEGIVLPAAPGLEPPAQVTLARAGYLVNAVVQVIEEGLTGRSLDRAALAHDVTFALRPYGLRARDAAPLGDR